MKTLTIGLVLALAGALPCRAGEDVSALSKKVWEGSRALKALAHLARAANEGDAVNSLVALAALGALAAPAKEDIVRSLLDTRPSVRLHAALALVKVDPKSAERAVKGLAANLKHEDPSERIAAMNALRQAGPAAVSMLPEIEKIAADDPVANVRSKAAIMVRVLLKLKKKRIDALRAELAALTEREKAIRAEAERLGEGEF